MMYSQSYWRNAAAPIISKVLTGTKGQSEKEIRKALHDAYPFGMRKYHPYKIWCSEVRRQRAGGRFVILDNTKPLVFGNRNNPYGEQL
jgi:hypothetical protein